VKQEEKTDDFFIIQSVSQAECCSSAKTYTYMDMLEAGSRGTWIFKQNKGKPLHVISN
jgi:hypothetical protein